MPHATLADYFLYSEEALYCIKTRDTLVLIYFVRPQLGHTINRNCMTF